MLKLVRFVVLALTLTLLASAVRAELTDEQKQQGIDLQTKITELRKLVGAKKNDEAGKILVETEKLLDGLKDADDSPAYKRVISGYQSTLTTFRKTLTSRGVKLEDVAAPAPKPATPGTPATQTAAGGTSFMRDVVPILAGKCGGCHMGNQMRGQFSMATFDALMKGAKGSSVVEAGKSKASRLVEVIESGDMPRGGGKVSMQELAVISKWIDDGAKFDGQNRTMPLRVGRPDGPRLEVATATGNEKIKFSRDIAPVLVANCTSCHGGGDASGDLNLDSFQAMLRGGDRGNAIVPGNPGESLLIKKLKGTADGMRMPARKDPLKDEIIAKFELWIQEGAKFDGPSPTMPTETVANIYAAQQMTHEELSAHRLELASANWKLGNPDLEAEVVETPHFRIMGDVIKSRLEEIGKIAEDQYEKVSNIFAVPDNEQLLKGKLTLFVFNRYYEYTEYGTMVERRSLPRDWRGHWKYTIIDAYACLAPPKEDEDTAERLISELLVGAHIDSLGKVPTWFAQGAARAVSAKSNPKSPAVLTWEGRIPGIASSVQQPEKLFDNEIEASDAAVMSYGFVKALLGKTANYQTLLKSLKSGKDFDAAFMDAYKADPPTLLKAWAAGAKSGRKR